MYEKEIGFSGTTFIWSYELVKLENSIDYWQRLISSFAGRN